MMGHHARSVALFYYFRLEDYVPENHLLRLIDKHVSFSFVRDQLKESYSSRHRLTAELIYAVRRKFGTATTRPKNDAQLPPHNACSRQARWIFLFSNFTVEGPHPS